MWKTIINAIEKKSSLEGEDDLKKVAGSENLQSIGDGHHTVAEMKRSDLNVMIEPKKSSNMEIVANMDDSTGTKSENYINEVPEIKKIFK